jgi:hypothetical protein
VIDPEFSEYHELLQRVVVFMLLHTGDDGLILNGVDLARLAGAATTGAVAELNRLVGAAESKVTTRLNAEVPVTDKDNRIKTLSMSVELIDQRMRLVVNIETESGNIITGAADING